MTDTGNKEFAIGFIVANVVYVIVVLVIRGFDWLLLGGQIIIGLGIILILVMSFLVLVLVIVAYMGIGYVLNESLVRLLPRYRVSSVLKDYPSLKLANGGKQIRGDWYDLDKSGYSNSKDTLDKVDKRLRGWTRHGSRWNK